jgi:hypothetical protein
MSRNSCWPAVCNTRLYPVLYVSQSERVVLDALDSGLLEGRTTLVIAHRYLIF